MFGMRSRSRFRLPITLSASLITANVALMTIWIVLFAQTNQTAAVTIGVIAFALILVGLTIWLVLTIKEIRLNHRQANFVDSVTHELKTPIATLQLYLETLKMRTLNDEQRSEFHDVMAVELQRLDRLINQLLEVGRLDAIGEDRPAEDVELGPILERDARAAAKRFQHNYNESVTLSGSAASVVARRIVVELIISNLIDNAFKYGGDPPRIVLHVENSGGRVRLVVRNNGERIPFGDRKKIFRVFYRGGSELQRRQKGTGIGLFIVSTLVKQLRGRIIVRDPDDEVGCEFILDLPGIVRVDEPLVSLPEGEVTTEFETGNTEPK